MADLLDRYTTDSTSTVQQDKRYQAPVDYTACGTNKTNTKQIFLNVIDKDGNGSMIAYSYITRMQYTGHQFISIISTDCIVTLKGENLSEVRDMLQGQKVQYLQEFNATRFKKPLDGKPFIKKITLLEMHSKLQDEQTA